MQSTNSSNSDFIEQLTYQISSGITYFTYIPYIFLYIIYIVPIFKEKQITYLSGINLQFIFACTLNTISFTLPGYKEDGLTGPLCYFQAFINTLSDQSKLTILTASTLGSFLSVMIPQKLDKYYLYYLVITSLIQWIPPLTFSILAMFKGNIQSFQEFCWINNINLMYAYYGVLFLFYTIFYICSIGLFVQICMYFRQFKERRKQLKRYALRLFLNVFIVSFIFITFALNLSAIIYKEIVEEDKRKWDMYYLTIFTALMESLSNLVLSLVFGLNSDKINDMKKVFCCKGKEEEEDLLDEEGSVEIGDMLIK